MQCRKQLVAVAAAAAAAVTLRTRIHGGNRKLAQGGETV